MKMKQPAFLDKGDKILLVAPSFGVATEPYSARQDLASLRLRKLGFRVEEGPCVHLAEGVASSATPEKRAKEIMDGFRGDASLLLSVGGGETMNEILPYIDFAAIASSTPKWFMGFSDNTNLCFPLATLAGVMSIYGPCGPSFYLPKQRLAEKDALRMLQGEKHFEGYPKYSITHWNPDHPLWAYRCTQPKVIQAVGYEKPMEGVLLGGCMDCLVNLCGTRFDKVKEFNVVHPEGVLWFLEACDLSPLGIRRALFQLREAGWFANAKGFLLGRHLCQDAEVMGVNKYNAALDILSPLGLPILMDIDLGHVSPSMPIKEGARARVSLAEGNIVFDYLD